MILKIYKLFDINGCVWERREKVQNNLTHARERISVEEPT